MQTALQETHIYLFTEGENMFIGFFHIAGYDSILIENNNNKNFRIWYVVSFGYIDNES